MIYLKLYEMFNSTSKIDDICKEYIDNYTINSDGTVDVNGDVLLASYGLKKIPLKFGKVSGNFYCVNNHLKSLEGCPKEVGGKFYCGFNELNSLNGSPKKVGGNFNCINNKLKSLEGCPIYVGGVFSCSNNELTSLDGCPKEVANGFYCNLNPVSIVYKLIEEIVKKDYYNLIEFVENWNPIRPGNIIILDRLNDYLETFGGKPVTSVEGYKCI